MKIFGIGLPRTGTTSAAVAMLHLGFKTCHNCFDDAVFEIGDAFFDTPIYADYPSLDRRFPGSRFILTWAAPSKWHASFSGNLGQYLDMLRSGENTELSELDRRCYSRVFGNADSASKEQLISRYFEHRTEAEKFFRDRPKDFLILDWEASVDPWTELCSFLDDRPRPEIPFPRVNAKGAVLSWEDVVHPKKLGSGLDERWLRWIHESLRRRCDPNAILEILLKRNTPLPLIRRAMGDSFPETCPQVDVAACDSGASLRERIVAVHEQAPSTRSSDAIPAVAPDTSAKTLFVQIASYRDEECQWTLKDLFEKAKHPDRIHVGVCWQYDPYQDRDCFAVCTRPEQVRMALFHWKESQGVCWARRQAQQLWRGEDYVLMVDSHMRFAQDWDERLIRQLDECPSPKPVLTNYPASYRPPDQLDLRAMPTVMLPKPFTEFGSLRFHSVVLDRFPDKPLRGAFIAAGFVFAASGLISEVPYDPYMYFDQEEVSLAARLFTHGFDVYSLKDILAYHYYNCLQDEKRRPLHWADNRGWGELQKRANKRFDHLVGYAMSDDFEALRELDKYGLGDARSLAEYEEFCGIDFKRRCVTERALRCEFIDDLHKYKKTPLPLPEPDVKQGSQVAPTDVKTVFTGIYNAGGWISEESISGPGSSLLATAAVREQLPGVIEQYAIRTLLDIGCGDCHWLKETELCLEKYLGADVVAALVDWNRLHRSGPGREFIVLDVCSEPLPTGVDLVLCRDCVVHLSNDCALAALKNIATGGAKYLLATTFPGRGSQPDAKNGQWRPLDLQAEPFSFPEPLLLISEKYSGDNGQYADKSLGLWECESVKLARFQA